MRLAILILAAAAVAVLASGLTLDEPAARFAQQSMTEYRPAARIFTDLGLAGWMLGLAAIVAGLAYILRRKATTAFAESRLSHLFWRGSFVFTTVFLSGIVAQILKHMVGRGRPVLMEQFGTAHFDAFSYRTALASFPSGHTTSAFAAVSALILLAPRFGWSLLPLACAVGASRWAIGAHYVSDVVAGAALGVATTLSLAHAFGSRDRVFRKADGHLVVPETRGTLAVVRLGLRALRSRVR